MALRVLDTLSGEKRPFETLEPGKVRMYVCGVTPYARCHLGHARCYVAWDLVYRYLKYAGYEVTYVRNFTDVDDKIIARAAEREMDPLALAEENIQAFYQDMDALGIARPQQEPRVSTSIPEIIELVQTLVDKGLGYAVDGDVYYAVEKFEPYGQLSKRNLDDMRAGERVEINTAKRNPMDFALWKAAKPGEIKWDSPWGPGRPGWHIECSAMSLGAFGDKFDLHGGGRDLVFPHHENELAQSDGARGHQCCNYWLHNGFITIDEQKMGKSLGNAFDIADLFARYEPTVLRWYLLSASAYRNPINFGDTLLDEAAVRVGYFYETLRKVNLLLAEGHGDFTGPLPHDDLAATLDARFREGMDDDFNTPRAVEPVLEAFKALNELASTRKAKAKPAAAKGARKLLKALRKVDQVLNMFGHDPDAYLAKHRAKAAVRRGVDTSWVEGQIQARLQARADKEWQQADAIRDGLLAQGVCLMDRPDGTDWWVQDIVAAPADCA